MAKDLYEILGVGKTASKDEIKRAYRKLAHEHHPDKGSGEAEKFKELNQAYEVLSDETKRAQYDQFGQTFDCARGGQAGGQGFGGFSGFEDMSDFMRGFGNNASQGPYSGMQFDFGDIFSEFFGGGRSRPRPGRREQGVDLEMTLAIGFLESIFGVTKTLALERKDTCPRCEGSGAEPGSKVATCPKCHGQGQITSRKQTMFGTMQHVDVCDRCEGLGKIPEKNCSTCLGRGVKQLSRETKVVVPPGIDDGQRLKLTGEGELGYRGSRRGDLYIVIRVKKHPEFQRNGTDIISEVPVSFFQAALGANVDIDTVDGKVSLKVPAGIQSGKMLRLRSKGVPHLESTKRGDHIAIIRVVTPTKLTRKEKEILKKLAEERGESVNIDEGLWGKIKDSFE